MCQALPLYGAGSQVIAMLILLKYTQIVAFGALMECNSTPDKKRYFSKMNLIHRYKTIYASGFFFCVSMLPVLDQRLRQLFLNELQRG